ncbi:uncharacterized protein C7orf50 homolog isoform X11 [Mirounga angustirostris]|uniref:uncharacterized protein C7orf50 homolog isoform X11 n=1 Tax=Mirounga angustirostris TaxID=9716 RepID=UPI00313CA6EF
MEFPDLGKHCSEKTCKQLDFLPLKCDACKQDFCKDHFTCAAHKCPFAFKKDVQVPVCPLCNNPVPVKKGEIPDVVVGEHIDRDCNYHPRKKEKLFMYRCSKEGCKKKEMLQVACDQCRGSFCIQHRHPLDHSCKHGGRPVGAARMAKQKRKVTEMTEEKNKKLKKASTKEIQLAPRAVSGTKRAHPEEIMEKRCQAVFRERTLNAAPNLKEGGWTGPGEHILLAWELVEKYCAVPPPPWLQDQPPEST